MARRAPRAAQGRALSAGLAALATLVACAACGGGDAGPGGVVTVQVAYPGADPAEVASQVLAPIEQAVGSVAGLYAVRGLASDGLASLDVTFKRGIDSARARTAVQEALGPTRGLLPPAAELPLVSTRPAAWVLARISDHPREFEALFAQLGRLPVTWIEECGVREARLALELAPARLQALGLTAADVSRAISAANLTTPAGRIVAGASDQPLRIEGQITGHDELANLTVDASGARVRDVAVITQRAQATCLVDGALEEQAPALLRVGLRHSRDVAAVEQALATAKLTILKKTITVSRPGRPTRVEIVDAAGPMIEALVVGDDAMVLAEQGRNALASVRTAPGVAAAWCQGCELETTQKLSVDRARAATLGVDPASIAQAVRTAFGGDRVATYREQDVETGVVLSVENGGASWPELSVRAGDGRLVALRDLVALTASSAPRELLRVDGRNAVAVRLRGTPTTSVAELRKLATSALPAARVRTLDAVSVDAERW